MDKEYVVLCEVCGEPATKYFTSYPVCDCVVCFNVRLEHIAEVIKETNNKVKGKVCA